MLKRLFFGAALIGAANCAASAAPLGPAPNAHSPIILVSGGCGFAFHRNPFGVCVANRGVFVGGPPVVRLPPPCPRGYHRDPDPARPICYPNF